MRGLPGHHSRLCISRGEILPRPCYLATGTVILAPENRLNLQTLRCPQHSAGFQCRVQWHCDSCQGKHAQEAPWGATGIPGDRPVRPWGHWGHLQGTPGVKWSPVSCHREPEQGLGAEQGTGSTSVAPARQLRLELPRLTQQQMAQGPSWLASGMAGVGFLSSASLE